MITRQRRGRATRREGMPHRPRTPDQQAGSQAGLLLTRVGLALDRRRRARDAAVVQAEEAADKHRVEALEQAWRLALTLTLSPTLTPTRTLTLTLARRGALRRAASSTWR